VSVGTSSPVSSLLRPSRGLRTAIRAVLAVATLLVLPAVSIPTVVTAEDFAPTDPPVAEAPEPEPEPVAPVGSRCPELYAVAVEHWPGAALHWPVLDKIFWRESRCRPWVVNRYGCVGLMQVCRLHHRRLGVTRADLQDPAVNIEAGYQLCLESMRRRRSCFSPWWLGRWRP
jgi:soluble lytic murein transglycosylase-like protein